jgi:hypothetical protein
MNISDEILSKKLKIKSFHIYLFKTKGVLNTVIHMFCGRNHSNEANFRKNAKSYQLSELFP